MLILPFILVNNLSLIWNRRCLSGASLVSSLQFGWKYVELIGKLDFDVIWPGVVFRRTSIVHSSIANSQSRRRNLDVQFWNMVNEIINLISTFFQSQESNVQFAFSILSLNFMPTLRSNVCTCASFCMAAYKAFLGVIPVSVTVSVTVLDSVTFSVTFTFG